MKYFSEFGEDRWIAENCQLPSFGLYADVGCADPLSFSNTAFLREQKWRGVAIDGNPIYARKWGDEFVNAVISDQPTVPFLIHPNSVISRVQEGSPKVETVGLTEVLKRRGIDALDFLSIDAEGHEMEVLRTLDLKEYHPQVIVSEFNTEGIGYDFRVHDFLCNNGYRPIHRTFSNFIFHRL